MAEAWHPLTHPVVEALVLVTADALGLRDGRWRCQRPRVTQQLLAQLLLLRPVVLPLQQRRPCRSRSSTVCGAGGGVADCLCLIPVHSSTHFHQLPFDSFIAQTLTA